MKRKLDLSGCDRIDVENTPQTNFIAEKNPYTTFGSAIRGLGSTRRQFGTQLKTPFTPFSAKSNISSFPFQSPFTRSGFIFSPDAPVDTFGASKAAEKGAENEIQELKEGLSRIQEFEQDVRKGKYMVSSHMKKREIQRTFFRLSNLLILGLVLFLVYYNYVMIAPHVSPIIWALLWTVFLAQPQSYLTIFVQRLQHYPHKAYVEGAVLAGLVSASFTGVVHFLLPVSLFLGLVFLTRARPTTVVSTILVAVVLLIILFPLFFIAKKCYEESLAIVDRISQFVDVNPQFQQLLDNIGESPIFLWVRQVCEGWGYTIPQFQPEELRHYLSLQVSRAGSYIDVLFSGAFSLVSNIGNFFVSFMTFFSSLYFFLENRDSMMSMLCDLSPFSTQDNFRLTSSLRRSVWRIFICSFALGLVHIFVTYASFLICGIDLCLILSFLCGFAAMLPIVSSWIVWVPVCLALYINGDTFQCVFVASVQLMLSFYVSPLMYSLIPGNPYVIGTSIVMGIYVFGVIGMLAGPLLAGLSITVLDIYRDYMSMPLNKEFFSPRRPSKRTNNKARCVASASREDGDIDSLFPPLRT